MKTALQTRHQDTAAEAGVATVTGTADTWPGHLSLNLGDIFQQFRDGKPRTRADIAASTGLARGSVAAKIDQLVCAGLLQSVGHDASSGGRPPERIALNARAASIVALDVSRTVTTVALTDLTGRPTVVRTRRNRPHDEPQTILSRAMGLAGQLLQNQGDEVPCLGIGIGLCDELIQQGGQALLVQFGPGRVDGVVRQHVGPLDAPVVSGRRVDLIALSELGTDGQGARDLICVDLDAGVELAIISDGALRPCPNPPVGGFGQLKIRSSPRGTETALASVVSLPEMVRTLRSRGMNVADEREVADLLQAGDTVAVSVVRGAGLVLGGVLAVLSAALGSTRITLTGSLASSSSVFVDAVQEALLQRGPLPQEGPIVAPPSHGNRAALVGAALRVAHEQLAPRGIEMFMARSHQTASRGDRAR